MASSLFPGMTSECTGRANGGRGGVQRCGLIRHVDLVGLGLFRARTGESSHPERRTAWPSRAPAWRSCPEMDWIDGAGDGGDEICLAYRLNGETSIALSQISPRR